MTAPEVTREWPAGDTRHATPSHPIDWPLVAFVGLAVAVSLAFTTGALEGPITCEPLALVVALLAAAFTWLVADMLREEGRLNARGETLFPGQRRLDRRGILERTDRALREGVRDLAGGGDAALVLDRLQGATHGGDALPDGGARACYDKAVRCLEGAGAFPRVEGELKGEAAGWLRAARGEMRREWWSR